MRRATLNGATLRSGAEEGLACVRKLARRLDPEPPHVFQVAKNALSLFDTTRFLHKMSDEDRRLLHAASLLHDIGHTINTARHHKHSRDIIMELSVPSLSVPDKQIVACVARYHRKAHPAKNHRIFQDLRKSDQRRVSRLAALLRIADGLDRAHIASCKKIEATMDGNILQLIVDQRRNCPADIAGAQRKQALFEEIFGVRVSIAAAKKTIGAQGAKP